MHKLHSHFNIAPIEMGIYVKIKWIFCDLSNQKGSIYPATDRRDLDFTRKKDYTDKPTGRGVFCLFQALTARYLNVTDCGGVGRGGNVKGIESRDGYFWKGHTIKPVFFVCALIVFKILYSLLLWYFIVNFSYAFLKLLNNSKNDSSHPKC